MLPGGGPNLFPVNCDDVSHWKCSGLILPAEKFAEINWVKKASPSCCPFLKSSLNSANCRERLFKGATSGVEDRSIYLRVKTTQRLHWTPNTPGTRSLGWKCWNARSPVFIPAKRGTHQINYTVWVYSPPSSASAVRKCVLLGTPPFGCWFNLKCILGEREKEGEETESRVFCSKLPHRSCRLADTVGPEAVRLWDVLYFCQELSASEKLRRKRDVVSE